MNSDFRPLVLETRTILAYHRLLGIEAYPATEKMLSFLRPDVPPKKLPAPPSRSRETKTSVVPSAPIPDKPTGDIMAVRAGLGDCIRCRLHAERHAIVFGEGSARPPLMVIGDWPGSKEDSTGLPFQGQEGEMLTNMLKAIDIKREAAYVTTLVKCHPPTGRPPTGEEIAACLPILMEQITTLAPKVICTMGPLATQTLLHTDQPLMRLRGSFHNCQGVALMPTFHPRFLLKNPEMKKATWQDLLMIKKKLGS